MVRVDVKPEMLRWARERARRQREDLQAGFPKLAEWEAGAARPTLRQLERLAHALRVPVGYLFLGEPPAEPLPIPDLRTMGGRAVGRPSPDLLEMVYVCQQRQDWYRDFARQMSEEPLGFVGAASTGDDVVTTAARMREALGLDPVERRRLRTWEEALRRFITLAEDAGVLVMCSGVVLNNNTRKLDPEEFRGFAMADPLAPLVFINGADTKAAQMFTLAHELAHIWLGQSALSDATPQAAPSQAVERWCNRVAAELLVPLESIRGEYSAGGPLRDELQRLARVFKVSTLVVLRRIRDLGAISADRYAAAYAEELQRLMARARGTGGDFYLTQAARASRRFARALVGSALEGQTLFTDAFRLLGISKVETLREFGRNLESPL